MKACKAKARPITKAEYAEYMAGTGKEQLPASWTTVHTPNGVNGGNGHMNGHAALYDFIHDKAIRTVHGLVPLKYALHWPVSLLSVYFPKSMLLDGHCYLLARTLYYDRLFEAIAALSRLIVRRL